MKLSIWLLIACVALTVQSHAREVTLFDADPAHPWNQLYAALHTEVKVKDAETFEAYEKDALTGAKYGEALALLDRFVRRKQHRSIRDPIKRAILQGATWAAFDAASNPKGRFQEQRRAIAQRLGEIVRRLALTDDEIDRLPDNYAFALKSKIFPSEFDSNNRAQTFLPPDLLSQDSSWVMMSSPEDQILLPAAISHVEAVQGRSVFYPLMRLPGGRQETLAYIRKLTSFPTPYIPNEMYAEYPYARSPVRFHPDLPEFPEGTQFALLRRMILPNADGELRVTPITEGLQLRVYVNAPDDVDRTKIVIRAIGFYEATLVLDELFAGASGLRAPLELRDLPEAPRTVLAFPSFLLMNRGCRDCHSQNGIRSVQTYSRSFASRFGRASLNPWFEASQKQYQDEHTLDWKKRDYSWGLLQGSAYSSP